MLVWAALLLAFALLTVVCVLLQRIPRRMHSDDHVTSRRASNQARAQRDAAKYLGLGG